MSTNATGRAHGPAQMLIHDHHDEDQHHRTAIGGDGPEQALTQFLGTIGASPRTGQQRELARDGFTIWLIAQRDRDDWVGHLAQEVAYDTSWPRHAARLRELHDYLHDLYALDDRHAALDQAWAEWREVAR